jgi:hypothetical protein
MGSKGKIMSNHEIVPYKTWTTGNLVDAADLNEQIRDNGDAIWLGNGDANTAGDMDYSVSSSLKGKIAIAGSTGKVLTSDGSGPGWEGDTGYAGARIAINDYHIHSSTNFGLVSSGNPTVVFDTGGFVKTFPSYQLHLYPNLTGIYLFTATIRLVSNGYAGNCGISASIGDGYTVNAQNFYTTRMNGTNDCWLSATVVIYVYPTAHYWYASMYVNQETGYDLNYTNASVALARLK